MRKAKIIVIDLEKVAEAMIKAGFTKEKLEADQMDNWTNTLIDSLEEIYNLESKISEVIKQGVNS